jgi:DNA-binding Lrp family transcriptional regulator
LEEIAVLRVIQQNPSAPQKFVASEIGKSERTVKSITARLTKQGIIRRSKGKGSPWEIIKD